MILQLPDDDLYEEKNYQKSLNPEMTSQIKALEKNPEHFNEFLSVFRELFRKGY